MGQISRGSYLDLLVHPVHSAQSLTHTACLVEIWVYDHLGDKLTGRLGDNELGNTSVSFPYDRTPRSAIEQQCLLPSLHVWFGAVTVGLLTDNVAIPVFRTVSAVCSQQSLYECVLDKQKW